MLFNSFEFIFIFLPATFILYVLLGRAGLAPLKVFLVITSLIFYGFWIPKYLLIILGSIAFNYFHVKVIGVVIDRKGDAHWSAKILVGSAIAGNLFLLGYFKYKAFFLAQANIIFDSQFSVETLALPLGISFFTFQQITLLVDLYKRKLKRISFTDYCLFVTFFPQLIAGPIVHHSEMMPQFSQSSHKVGFTNLTIGLILFSIGLFKKVVIADTLATFSTPTFHAAEVGYELTLLEAWCGVLSYSFQLYFDFSGYCDMGLGLARMFGIRLPFNFFSPYRATSIIDFWRRWHMTLSRFLKDYIYIPLGGSRLGTINKARNILITMVLGGFWHGAGWTFVLWGFYHGILLVGNHIFRSLTSTYAIRRTASVLTRSLGWSVTYISVVLGWVLFRSETFDGAVLFYSGLFGLNGIIIPAEYTAYINMLPAGMATFIFELVDYGFAPYYFGARQLLILALCLCITLFFPSVKEIIERKLLFRKYYGAALASISGVLFFWALTWLANPSEFLYFQF